MLVSRLGLLVLGAALVLASFSFSAMAQTTTAPAPKPKAPATVPAYRGGLQTLPANGPDMTSRPMAIGTSVASKGATPSAILLQGQNSPIALIAFGREKKGDPLRMIIQLPTNVTFEGGVKTLTASGDAVVDMMFRRCFPVGCFADATMTEAQVLKLKTQAEPMSIKSKDATEREISLPLSLNGFGPAVEALSRT
jgi:hypothetical protein